MIDLTANHVAIHRYDEPKYPGTSSKAAKWSEFYFWRDNKSESVWVSRKDCKTPADALAKALEEMEKRYGHKFVNPPKVTKISSRRANGGDFKL